MAQDKNQNPIRQSPSRPSGVPAQDSWPKDMPRDRQQSNHVSETVGAAKRPTPVDGGKGKK